MYRKCDYLFVLLLLVLPFGNGSAQVKLTREKMVLPSYKVNLPDKNPMFFKGEVYQGASKVIYPYALMDNISDERTMKAWESLVLENEYIKLCVTPEIGGKLYYAMDKTNGYDFIYKNNVVKPSNIGMLGAWVSGGIEWCVFHHHRASTFLPVDYELTENNDGSKTIWVGETEPRQRMRWMVGITVFPDRSYFEAQVKIMNPTPFTHSFLYWANVATHASDGYQVIFPPSVQYVTYHAKNSFAHFPVSYEIYNGIDFTRGVDISWWKNHIESNSLFAYDLKEDFMGGYDHGKETGTVHVGDHNIVKGAKLWEWGSGTRGQATEARLTETDGPYVEIMVGAFSDNQPDYSWIKPYEVKSFRQYWYPVRGIKGFKNANLNGAVNLEASGKDIFIGYYSTKKLDGAKVILKKGSKVIFEKVSDISPDKPFTQTLTIQEPFKVSELSTELISSLTGERLIFYNPVEKESDRNLPPVVEKPPLPSDITTVEELFLAGQRIQQFHNPTLNAMDYYLEALRRDKYDIRTNTAVGSTYLRNGDYIQARTYLSRAVNRLTKDYTRPVSCEALYLQGLTLKALELYDEAADTLYRATWDQAFYSAAYFELAGISCIRGNLTKALEEINRSLSTNMENNSALNMKAAILRKMGRSEEAANIVSELVKTDPLDFMALNEQHLLLKSRGDISMSEKLLADLSRKMRDFEQNYIELALFYLNLGFMEEAEDILIRFKGKYPMVYYYLGYINDKKGKREQAEKFFSMASDLPVDYCFPFRLESEKVLKQALIYQPDNPKPYYYLGNLFYDRQPHVATGYWEKATEKNPSMAIAQRNLGWAYYHTNHDIPKAILAYEKAVENKKDDPVYYLELDQLYEMNNASAEKRLKLFEMSNDVVRNYDDAFVREIIVLTLAGKPDKAVEYLSGKTFHYREGSSRVRDITADAHLMLGRKYFAAKDYRKALEQFQLADESPDIKKDVRRLSDSRSPQAKYFIGLAFEALGDRTKARAFFRESVSQPARETGYIRYYQGLSYQKLGDKDKSAEIFNSMIAEGDKRISQGSDVDFFAKFGEKSSEIALMSEAYMLKGLGYKGLGQKDLASENLKKAVELSASNLWASAEL